ncbi:hypothetical protein T4D_15964 [Trichinella pseudospiralis]|uniref:Uncharacterized protein n=1 Tax=Trichinella pseudospiralis TaxID=6337 RepID=A0A0V1FAU0_TRIPS|nr:hypothetical protein T4D_15964 [Trichinella pseudospiralis]
MSDEFTFASLNIKFFEKMLFHKLWQADCANWNRETKSLWNIIIPRWLILFPIKKASSVELHMSCSASKWGYEAIVYVKTIIVPLKTMMWPRRKKVNGCCNSITSGQTSCVY